jgi:protein-L-isoaspartate O-methyltransferase
MVQDLTWRHLARALADSLEASGDLVSAHWRRAVEETPRHPFVPAYYLPQGGVPTTWRKVTAQDGDEWLRTAYENRTLVTRFSEPGSGLPTSSSTAPSLVVRMLELLDVEKSDDVLDLGTGTGYQTALLAHRLSSPEQLVSADIDPELTDAATRALSGLGLAPQLRTVDGTSEEWGEQAFDKIIASCALPRVSGPLRSALRPGGRLIANLFPPLSNTLVVLDHQPNGSLKGRFHPDGGSFMAARVSGPSPDPETPERPSESGTTEVPQEAFDNYHFLFLLAAHLPGAQLQYGTTAEATTRRIVVPGGWAQATYGAGSTWSWAEAGGHGVWETVERRWQWFNDLDQPTWDRFGLTVTPENTHVLWFQNPSGPDRWTV